ncbi:hypothetical protein [Spiroplasma endosymbiont of Atherix ibis]|uniref:hypothetical protein n=1 Tax=Spiroplasma endosymbiont of Atherix ibis TaxID=3066291 RepID=UPI0030CF517D
MSIMSILHLSLIQNTISNKKINYQLLDDYSKTKQNINFTFNEVNLISSITNNLIHQNNFSNIKIINSKNELLLDDYYKYLLNYCDGSNTEILYVNQKIYPVCNVFDYKINDEYNKKNGINLIWKNLMRSDYFESIMGQITLWFQNQNNFYKGLEKINKTLKSNYQWDKNKIEELKFLVRELNFKNGKLILKINNSSDFQITLINNFFKDIFYFYLISYINNPLEFDEITEKSYIETFHSFLYFK